MDDHRHNAASRAERRTVAGSQPIAAEVRWFRRPWALEAAGAGALAVVLAGYAVVSFWAAPPDAPTPIIGPGIAGGIAVVKPTTAAPFDRIFAWHRVDTATSYQVVLFSDAGDRVFEVRDLKVPSVKIGEAVALTPGRYFWQVAALRDGQPLAESARTEFVIP